MLDLQTAFRPTYVTLPDGRRHAVYDFAGVSSLELWAWQMSDDPEAKMVRRAVRIWLAIARTARFKKELMEAACRPERLAQI